MKPKNARYLGMTTSQLGILGGAAVVALLVICGLSWFVFIAPPSRQVATVPEVLSTPTQAAQVIVVTSAPTPSPEIATSVPPDGWVEFQTEGATIWLPGSFVGGDLLQNKQETISKINKLGKFYKNTVNGLKNAPLELVLCMVDKTPKVTDIVTNVLVTHRISTEDTSIDQYLESFLNSSVNGTPVAMLITVNQTKKMTLLGRETRRLTYSQYQTGHEVIGLIYYIKDGADIWTVDYSLVPYEYPDMLPIVEQSISTFNLVK